MERSQSGVDQNKIMGLTATLNQARKDKDDLEAAAASGGEGEVAQGHRADAAISALDMQKAITAKALAQVEVLNQQISALRQQLAAIQEALDISKTSQKQAQEKIADLGQRLNLALAQKVQELARYRSDFFGRLRQILGDRPDISDRRRPLRVPILGAVRSRQGGSERGRQEIARPTRRGRARPGTRNSRPTFPGYCASTATPMLSPSLPAARSSRTGICRPPAPSPSCNI